ncbi:TPA: hypothetical protein JBI12_11280 [Legionella pneumophila]|nr:hypothetical protein [Legionella pneumophila]
MSKSKFFSKDFKGTAFDRACVKIEIDPNYINGVSNKELFNLVVDEKGNSRYEPRKNALVIEDSEISKVDCKVYNIRIARKCCVGNSDYPVWNIDDSVVILVNKDGVTSIHSTEDALKNEWSKPISHLSVDKFLNCECLHPQIKNDDIQNSLTGPQ